MAHSICICFSTSDDIFSKTIRWITQSEVSHCYITFKSETLGEVMAMEADWFGFMLVPWKRENQKGKDVVARYSINISEEKKIKALRRLTSYIGAGYNYKGILPLALKRVRDILENPWNDPNKIICSETVVIFMKEAGIITDIGDPSLWTPGDVYNYVKKCPNIFIKKE